MMKNSWMSNFQPQIMITSSHIKMTKNVLIKECLPQFVRVMINNMKNKQSPVFLYRVHLS